MAMTMLRQEQTGWQTVKSRRNSKRVLSEKTEKKKKNVGKNGMASAPVDPAEKAFSKFDALFEKKVAPVKTAEPQEVAKSDVETPETPPQSQEAARKPIQQKQLKKEKKKPEKKPGKKTNKSTDLAKASTGQSRSIALGTVKGLLREVETRYPKNDAAQLEYIADKFLASFKDLMLPFPAELYIKPVEETVDMLQGVLPAKVTEELEYFLKRKSVAGTSEALCVFLRALFDSVSGPKSCLKGQVGLVLLVAAIVRMSSVALIKCMEQLVMEGPRFTAPNKLPLLIWLFAQAERSACGSSLALWFRVFPPQLLGVELQDPAAQKTSGKKKKQSNATVEMYSLDPTSYPIVQETLERSLNGGKQPGATFSGRVLAVGKEGLKYQEKKQEALLPVVTLSSLDQIISIIHTAEDLPLKLRQDLQSLYPTLRTMAFKAPSHPCLTDFLRQSLIFAGKSEGGYLGPGDEMVSLASENAISCLSADSECFEVWAVSHKKQIKGSCRILQHLLHVPSKSLTKLFGDDSKKQAFLEMLKNLQLRHGFLLAQGRGWQAACAKGAHEAARKFLDKPGKIPRKSRFISTKALFTLCLTSAVSVAVVTAKWDEIQYAFDGFMGSEAGKKLLDVVESDSVQGLVQMANTGVDSVSQFWNVVQNQVLSFSVSG